MIGLLPFFLYWEVQPLNSMFFGVYSPHSLSNFTSSNSPQTTTTNIVWIMICVEWMYSLYRKIYLTNNKKLFCILQWYSIYQNKPVSMPSEPIWWTAPHGIVTEWTAWGSNDRNRSNRACTGPGIGYLAEIQISFQVVSSVERPRFLTSLSWQALGLRHWAGFNYTWHWAGFNNKMAAIIKKTFTISFYGMNIVLFWSMFNRNLLPLQWRHNSRDGVSNHQPHDCLLNRLFRRRYKKTSKHRWPLCWQFTGDRWIPRTNGQ